MTLRCPGNLTFPYLYRHVVQIAVLLHFNPIRPGGRGMQNLSLQLTLNVNNFFNIEANATKLSDFY